MCVDVFIKRICYVSLPDSALIRSKLSQSCDAIRMETHRSSDDAIDHTADPGNVKNGVLNRFKVHPWCSIISLSALIARLATWASLACSRHTDHTHRRMRSLSSLETDGQTQDRFHDNNQSSRKRVQQLRNVKMSRLKVFIFERNVNKRKMPMQF